MLTRYMHIDEALRVAADRVSAKVLALLDGRDRDAGSSTRR
jgi:hypothetical protein